MSLSKPQLLAAGIALIALLSTACTEMDEEPVSSDKIYSAISEGKSDSELRMLIKGAWIVAPGSCSAADYVLAFNSDGSYFDGPRPGQKESEGSWEVNSGKLIIDRQPVYIDSVEGKVTLGDVAKHDYALGYSQDGSMALRQPDKPVITLEQCEDDGAPAAKSCESDAAAAIIVRHHSHPDEGSALLSANGAAFEDVVELDLESDFAICSGKLHAEARTASTSLSSAGRDRSISI